MSRQRYNSIQLINGGIGPDFANVERFMWKPISHAAMVRYPGEAC
jgi:hypothetical protein